MRAAMSIATVVVALAAVMLAFSPIMIMSVDAQGACLSNPCQNGGSCVHINAATAYYCDCVPSKSGALCQFNAPTITQVRGCTDSGLTTTDCPTEGAGRTITVVGTNFVTITSVTVGGRLCTSPNTQSTTQVTCNLPGTVSFSFSFFFLIIHTPPPQTPSACCFPDL